MDAQPIRNKMSKSNFLKGTDIGSNREVPVTVSKVELSENKGRDGSATPQFVLHFEGKEKKLGLNVGNTDTMIMTFGPETDEWVGKEITLFTVQTQNAQGQPTLGIRIKGKIDTTIEGIQS